MPRPVSGETVARRGIHGITIWIHVVGRIAGCVVARLVIRLRVAVAVIRVGVIRTRIVRPLIDHVGLWLINHNVPSSWSYDNQTLREHSQRQKQNYGEKRAKQRTPGT